MTMPAQLPPNPDALPENLKKELDELPDGQDLPEVSEAEAQQAAHESGMHLVDLKRIKHFAKIGRYLAKQGLVPVQRAKLAGRMQALEKAREKMAEMLDLEFIDDDVPEEQRPPVSVSTGKMVVGVAQTISILVKTENESAELDLQLEKMARDDAPKTAPTNRPPPPGASVHLTGTLDLRGPEKKPIDTQQETV